MMHKITRHRHFLIRLTLLLAVIGLVTFVYAQQDSAPLYALPSANETVYTSNTIDRTADGRTMIAANMLNDTVSIINLSTNEIEAEIIVGDDPRTLTYTTDENRILTVNRADGTLNILDLSEDTPQISVTYPVGVLPYAVVSNEDNRTFISLQGSAEVIEIDIDTGDILTRIDTAENPTGLALWGDFLYVTHLWSGELSLIYLPQKQVVRNISTGQNGGLTPSITIDPRNGTAYLPQSRANADNPALTYDALVLPQVSVVDLADLSTQRTGRIALDSADRVVNMPFAGAVDSVRNVLYIINAGSNDLSVIDLETGVAQGHLRLGANPRGVLLSRDGSFLFVHNVIDGTLTTIQTSNLSVVDILPISDVTIPIDILIGAELFHTATDSRLSNNNAISCASCHFDGQSDGQIWAGFADGARNTPALYDLLGTAPYTWTGLWDEVADVELKIRGLQAGDGLVARGIFPPDGEAHSGLSPDLDTLVAYLYTLQGPTTPSTQNPDSVARGEVVFDVLDCASCHSGEPFTDGLSHDVGTDGTFNTPTLRWLWQSAPYLHDGRAETLHTVFTLPGAHQLIGEVSNDDIDVLIAYLLSLPASSDAE